MHTYDTLQAANAVKDGKTISLQEDVSLSKIVTIEKDTGYYTIDGNGYTISMAENADCGAFYFKKQFLPVENTEYPKFMLKNVTVEGFVGDKIFDTTYYVINSSECKLNIQGCRFTNNSGISIWPSQVTNLRVSDCTFESNKAAAIAYNTDGRINVENCMFNDNTINGSGVIYYTTKTDGYDVIRNNMFSNNTVTYSGNAAVVYLSYSVEDLSGNLFINNSVTVDGTSSKEGVIVLGTMAGVTNINGNAFVKNTLGTVTTKYATVYAGTKCDVSNNYWGDGEDGEMSREFGKNIWYTYFAVTKTSYAKSYEVNSNGRGVTVTTATE